MATAGNQRPEHQGRGTHGLDQFIGGFGRGQSLRMNGGAMLGAAVAEFDFGSHGGKEVARSLNVAHLRNVFEDDRFVGEQGSGHAGKRSVFCAADADGAEQRFAAADYELIHEYASWGASSTLSPRRENYGAPARNHSTGE